MIRTYTLTSLSQREVLRYLGFGQNTPDAAMQKLVEQCIETSLSLFAPKGMFAPFALQWEEDRILLEDTALSLTGQSIRKHLQGCTQAYLLCVTVGFGIEQTIRTAMLTAPAQGVILDACATAAVEQLADLAEADIRTLCQQRGQQLTHRFSPGYGDLPITSQQDFVHTLDTYRRIGVTVNAGMMLTPGKSVTAILGVLPPCAAHLASPKSCAGCDKGQDCPYRKQ